MHSTAERGGASRRRRVSRGKLESQHEEENELQAEEKERVGTEVAGGVEEEWQPANGEGRRRLEREPK